MATFTPIPFDPVNDGNILKALGYQWFFHEANWQDVGGPESGPKIVGYPAHTAWFHPTSGHEIIIEGEMIVDSYHSIPDFVDRQF